MSPVPPPLTPRLLDDRKEAARQLSISVRSLDYLVADKRLRTLRKGKKVMIPHGEVVRYAGSNDYRPMTPKRGRRLPEPSTLVITLPGYTFGTPVTR
jgi:hypothetical protein